MRKDLVIGGADFGSTKDPMVGKRIGGVNVFGGGLGLNKDGKRVGGLGVSGDASCTDHMVAWRIRNALSLDGMGQVGGVLGDPKRPPEKADCRCVYRRDGGAGRRVYTDRKVRI